MYTYFSLSGQFKGVFTLFGEGMITVIIFGMVLVISMIFSALLLGYLLGKLGTNGIYFGRSFLEKSQKYAGVLYKYWEK